jgi:hypothetical protein
MERAARECAVGSGGRAGIAGDLNQRSQCGYARQGIDLWARWSGRAACSSRDPGWNPEPWDGVYRVWQLGAPCDVYRP